MSRGTDLRPEETHSARATWWLPDYSFAESSEAKDLASVSRPGPRRYSLSDPRGSEGITPVSPGDSIAGNHAHRGHNQTGRTSGVVSHSGTYSSQEYSEQMAKS